MKQQKIKNWWENLDASVKECIYLAGGFAAGCMAGLVYKKTQDLRLNLGLAMVNRDGFMKYFDEDGNEIPIKEWMSIVREYYGTKK